MTSVGGVRSVNAVINLNLNNAGIHSYAPAASTDDLGLFLGFDDNVYLADFPIYEGPSKAWMVSNEAGFSSLLTYQDWIGSPSGQDAGSLADEGFEVPASCFVGVGQLDFRLTPSCPAVGAGNWSAVNDGADPSLRAVRDFYGRSRYDVFPFPSAGIGELSTPVVTQVDAISSWGRAGLVLALMCFGLVGLRQAAVVTD
jgi:hypothetical protein